MKKLFLPTLLALIIALASPVYTQTQSSNTVPTEQTITFLIDQNEKARVLITTQEARIKDLEAEVSAERENGESLNKSYTAAQSEISALKSANESLHKAVTLNEQTISLLQTDRDKWKDKAKKETRAKYKAYVIAAGVIALKFSYHSMSDFKSIILAMFPASPAILAAFDSPSTLTIVASIVLPCTFFVISKTIDVLIQLYIKRRDR
jgi:uncharacterized lipoprotein YajG